MTVRLKITKPAITSRGWLALIVLGLMIAGGIMGQLQQSGGPGSSVTLLTGAALVGKVGLDQTTPGTTNAVALSTLNTTPVSTSNGTADAGTLRVAIASNNTAFPVNATLQTGSNVIGTVNTIPKTACGNTLATGSTLAAVPTSATLLTSAATACVVSVGFFNTNAGATTVTLTDNTATPINAMLTFSIPGLSNVIEPLAGASFNLGVKWTASGTGVTGYVVAYQ